MKLNFCFQKSFSFGIFIFLGQLVWSQQSNLDGVWKFKKMYCKKQASASSVGSTSFIVAKELPFKTDKFDPVVEIQFSDLKEYVNSKKMSRADQQKLEYKIAVYGDSKPIKILQKRIAERSCSVFSDSSRARQRQRRLFVFSETSKPLYESDNIVRLESVSGSHSELQIFNYKMTGAFLGHRFNNDSLIYCGMRRYLMTHLAYDVLNLAERESSLEYTLYFFGQNSQSMLVEYQEPLFCGGKDETVLMEYSR